MRNSIRRILALPMLATAAVAGSAVAAHAAPAQESAPAVEQTGTGVITADGQPTTNGDYRQDLAAVVTFPQADPTVQDYVQITFHGVPTGPLVPLDENGQAEVPLYMSPGSYFVGANYVEDGQEVTDSVQLPGFTATAPLPGEEDAPVVPVQ
ncbi:hypothetical protein [Kocuria palustris]|uniref:hypothetical protein n=1 Tax=Kocuria palustris TaxID=71999 RepID=UPI00077B8270|nr:hypothetical protein [Kocuria palustris]MDH5150760.1 hypothetical protein [Kocuria palustris]